MNNKYTTGLLAQTMLNLIMRVSFLKLSFLLFFIDVIVFYLTSIFDTTSQEHFNSFTITLAAAQLQF